MRLWIAALVASLALWGGLRAQESSKPAAASTPAAVSSTVFVLRHAEKDAQGDPRDPGLSEKGQARARALARLVAPAHPGLLVASEYQRAQRTLAPLAEALGLKVDPQPAQDTAGLAKRLRALPPGSVSVVAGHSNTVPALVEALGGRIEHLEKGQLAESAFDRLFVVTLAPAGAGVATSVVELAYGD